MKGWVYVISNKAMPNRVKIGYTLKDPKLRAEELAGTGIPHKFEVDYEVLTENPRLLEQRAHSALHLKREAKEWFLCSREEAVATIRQLAADGIIYERFGQLDRIQQEKLRRERIERLTLLAEKSRKEKEVAVNREKEKEKIRREYDEKLRALMPEDKFWPFFFLILVTLMIGILMIDESAPLIPLLFFTAIASAFLSSLIEKKRKVWVEESELYQVIAKERTEKIALIDKKAPDEKT